MAATTYVQIYDLAGSFTYAVVTVPDASAQPQYATMELAIAAALAANPGLELRDPSGAVIRQDPAGDQLTS